MSSRVAHFDGPYTNDAVEVYTSEERSTTNLLESNDKTTLKDAARRVTKHKDGLYQLFQSMLAKKEQEFEQNEEPLPEADVLVRDSLEQLIRSNHLGDSLSQINNTDKKLIAESLVITIKRRDNTVFGLDRAISLITDDLKIDRVPTDSTHFIENISNVVIDILRTERKRQGVIKRFVNKIKPDSKSKEAKQQNSRRIRYAIFLILIGWLIGFSVWMWVSPNDFAVGNNDIKDANDVVIGQRTNHWTNGFYFFTTTLSSVGYGDICPQSTGAKVMVSIFQLFITTVSLGAVWHLAGADVKSITKKVKDATKFSMPFKRRGATSNTRDPADIRDAQQRR